MLFRNGEQIFAAKPDLARNPGLRRQQPQNGQRAHRLARSRLAHQAEHLAGRDFEGRIAHCGGTAISRNEIHGKIAHLE